MNVQEVVIGSSSCRNPNKSVSAMHRGTWNNSHISCASGTQRVRGGGGGLRGGVGLRGSGAGLVFFIS